MRLCLLPALILASPAWANDGFGGLSATGLTFGQTDAVAMEEERLFISMDTVAVDYVFRNTTDRDVTGEVIFPLPPIAAWTGYEGMMNLPEDLTNPDIVGFTATVDGTPVKLTIDRIAVVEEGFDEENPPSKQYDNPGRDVTADLARLGIPLELDYAAIRDVLLSFPEDKRNEAASLGLVEYYEGDPANDIPPDVYGAWSIVTRYHWTQTFPAGAVVKISHSYTNRPPGGLFYWTDPPEEYQTYLKDMYCIDDGTSKALVKALKNPQGDDAGNYGTAWNISYVLRTANSWAGPIGKFSLTLDKGDAKNILSLCADGVKKTGPTTFVIEKTNYSPDRDLEVLIVQPMQY
ncbi:MAG: DUF4424 domain-containing protein [Acetobacteraceae bacterium]|nr:MAG: DUF4424 domain-containing protein [Acetobacteraceae bacterium]